MQATARDESARGALLDALAVVEFLAAFGAACEARPLRLGELQAAAAWPLDSPTLPELYQALLRCVLIEQARAVAPSPPTPRCVPIEQARAAGAPPRVRPRRSGPPWRARRLPRAGQAASAARAGAGAAAPRARRADASRAEKARCEARQAQAVLRAGAKSIKGVRPCRAVSSSAPVNSMRQIRPLQNSRISHDRCVTRLPPPRRPGRRARSARARAAGRACWAMRPGRRSCAATCCSRARAAAAPRRRPPRPPPACRPRAWTTARPRSSPRTGWPSSRTGGARPPPARRPRAGCACRRGASARACPRTRSPQPPATPTCCRAPAQPAGLLFAAGGLARCASQLLFEVARACRPVRGPARALRGRLGAELHLRLLAALCNDITEGAILKAEIAQRADQALALAAERQKQLAEVGRPLEARVGKPLKNPESAPPLALARISWPRWGACSKRECLKTCKRAGAGARQKQLEMRGSWSLLSCT